jgi:hypothetical protein
MTGLSSSRLLPALAGLGALAALGCSLSVEAEIPEVEVTQRGVRFDGVPLGEKLGTVSTSRSFELSSANTAWAKELNSEVYALSVVMRANGNLANLDFIEAARVAMSDCSESLAPVDIIDYERPANTPSSSVIEVATQYPIDVTKLWGAKSTRIEVQVAGRLPEAAWSTDITLRLGGKITYKY